jgi:uncharacterized protein (DUF58 family)
MALDPSLLEKARRAPGRLRFEEALRLARQLGFEKVRQGRHHRVFRFGSGRLPLNLQEGPHARAKAYQVRAMLRLAGHGRR